MGDAVLRRVGNMLQEAFRATDIIGRFGGDEFVVLAKGMTSYESVERKCRRIHERMAGLLADRGKTDVTCSIGAVLINEQSADYDSVFRQADAALYEAKQEGKHTHKIRPYRPQNA